MIKLLFLLIEAFERLCDLFSDDEDYDPDWMDLRAWKETRIG